MFRRYGLSLRRRGDAAGSGDPVTSLNRASTLLFMETLNFEEARVLGCLIEKSMTTPDYYPMTVNALVAACNQKTNRDPVVEFDEATVAETLGSLDRRGLIGLTRVSGGRALKYGHHTGTVLRIDDEQIALIGVLLLRGPQTAAELRARTERYIAFGSVQDAEERLTDLTERDEPLVEHLEREPGQKERRYRCLLVEPGTPPAVPVPADLEQRVAALEAALEKILRKLGEE